MNDAITVAVLMVATSCAACGDHTSAQDRASGPSAATAQPVVDPDCSNSNTPYDTMPMLSGTHVGRADGTVDLGNGQSATVHFVETPREDPFPIFVWSATTPIALLKIRYLADRPAVAFPNFPPSMSGGPYGAPLTNGPITALPPDEVTIKFCYLASPSPVDAGTGTETGTGGPPVDAGTETGTGGNGPDSGTDAGSGGGTTL